MGAVHLPVRRSPDRGDPQPQSPTQGQRHRSHARERVRQPLQDPSPHAQSTHSHTRVWVNYTPHPRSPAQLRTAPTRARWPRWMPLGAVALGTDLPCEADGSRLSTPGDTLTRGWGAHAHSHTHCCSWEVTHRQCGSHARCARCPQSTPRRAVLGPLTRAVCRVNLDPRLDPTARLHVRAVLRTGQRMAVNKGTFL